MTSPASAAHQTRFTRTSSSTSTSATSATSPARVSVALGESPFDLMRRLGVEVGEERRCHGALGDEADEVVLDPVAELDPVRSPEVRVLVVRPEGRDLDDLLAGPDGDRPEAVLVDGAREDVDDPVRQGVRGEVPVGRLADGLLGTSGDLGGVLEAEDAHDVVHEVEHADDFVVPKS